MVTDRRPSIRDVDHTARFSCTIFIDLAQSYDLRNIVFGMLASDCKVIPCMVLGGVVSVSVRAREALHRALWYFLRSECRRQF